MNDASENEQALKLLEQGIAGDGQALSDAWSKHSKRLRQLVRLRMDRRLQGRVDPSDVLQEAFVDFSKRASEYVEDPKIPFFLWLRLLTGQRLKLIHRHHFGAQKRDPRREISLHRTAMPQATSVSLAAQLVGRLTTASRAVHRAELQVILQETVNAMEPLDREIVALRHFEELSNSETAEVLGIKPSAVSTRHVRALKKLRDALQGTPGFFPPQ